MQRHGVDLDGTLAKYDGQEGVDYEPGKIGQPIEPMLARVKKWLAQGDEVVILTARMHSSHGDEIKVFLKAFNEWCREHVGQVLEATCEKDPTMVDIWDDKAVRVIRETGIVSDGSDVDDPLVEPIESDGIGEYLSS